MGPTLLLFISFALFGFAGVAVWAVQMLWVAFSRRAPTRRRNAPP